MFNNKSKKYISIIIIISMLQQFMYPVEIYAKKNRLQEQKNEEMQRKKALSVKDQNQLKREIEALNSRINELEKKREDLAIRGDQNQEEYFKFVDEINRLNNELSEIQEGIKTLSEEVKKIKTLVAKILKDDYMHNRNFNFLDIFHTENFVTFSNQHIYNKKISEYKIKILDEYHKKNTELNTKKTETETKINELKKQQEMLKKNDDESEKSIAELEKIISESEENYNKLSNMLSQVQKEGKEIQKAKETIKKHQQKVEEQKKEKDNIELQQKTIDEGIAKHINKKETEKDKEKKNKIDPAKESAKQQDDGTYCWPAPGNHSITTHYSKGHQGIDIQTGRRTNCRAVASMGGVVVVSGKAPGYGGYGNVVVIRHKNGEETLYAHLAKVYVRSGTVVKKGDAVGLIGTTGRSTGIHLHFERRRNKRRLRPIFGKKAD